MPTKDQPDNGSMRLLSTEVKDNVPVVSGKNVTYETRTLYTYEADFEWNNSEDWNDLYWVHDVLHLKTINLLKEIMLLKGLVLRR